MNAQMFDLCVLAGYLHLVFVLPCNICLHQTQKQNSMPCLDTRLVCSCTLAMNCIVMNGLVMTTRLASNSAAGLF